MAAVTGVQRDREEGDQDCMNAVSIALLLFLAAGILFAGFAAIHRMKKGSSCCGGKEETVRRKGVSDRNRAHYPYLAEARINLMTCDNCAARVENALNQEDGVWASVRIDTGKALIRSKQPVDETRIRSRIIQAGYGVEAFRMLR